MSEYDRDCVNRFHPTKPVLACGVDDKVIILSAANSSIPFSNWSEKEIQFHGEIIRQIDAMEWNVSRILKYLNQLHSRIRSSVNRLNHSVELIV